MARKNPNLTEKLDAALLALMEAKGQWYDREKLKGLPAGTVASWFEVDHYPIPVASGGGNHPTNLVPRLKADHRDKTAKMDIPMIAKGKRIMKTQSAHKDRIAIKQGLQEEVDAIMAGKGKKRKAKIANRGMMGSKASGWKKGFDGRAIRRDAE